MAHGNAERFKTLQSVADVVKFSACSLGGLMGPVLYTLLGVVYPYLVGTLISCVVCIVHVAYFCTVGLPSV